MGEELLVNEQIDAGADFVRAFDDSVPVSVACWIVPSDADTKYLYVASDDINDSNTHAAYGEVLRTLSGKKSKWLGPFQIKLVNTSHPVAQDAIEVRERFPAPIITRFGGTSIGGMSIHGACIYPPVSSMKAAT